MTHIVYGGFVMCSVCHWSLSCTAKDIDWSGPWGYVECTNQYYYPPIQGDPEPEKCPMFGKRLKFRLPTIDAEEVPK